MSATIGVFTLNSFPRVLTVKHSYGSNPLILVFGAAVPLHGGRMTNNQLFAFARFFVTLPKLHKSCFLFVGHFPMPSSCPASSRGLFPFECLTHITEGKDGSSKQKRGYKIAMPILSSVMQQETRNSIKKNKNIKHVICHRRNRICFVLTDDKTIAVTATGSFLLEAVVVPGDLWRRRLNKIRTLILERKIDTYDELLSYCRPGVVFTWVKVEWYI